MQFNARRRATLKGGLIGGGLVGASGFVTGLVIASVAASAAWGAVPDEAVAPPPRRTVSAVVYGNDPCPASRDGEIVVCARQPESERYRVPKRFREARARAQPGSNAWGNKVATLDQVGRTSSGVPDSCSAVGSGGQSGCYRAFLAQARQQRKADRAEAAAIP